MSTTTFTSFPQGFTALRIAVEVALSNSLPTITIVGLGNKSVEEAKERVRSAITASGLHMPRKHITVNLAPANVPKDGSSFDLPIAVAILAASNQVTPHSITSSSFVGELGLDGTLRSVPGIIGHIKAAKDAAAKAIYIPYANKHEAMFMKGIDVYAVKSIRDLFRHLRGESAISPIKSKSHHKQPRFTSLIEHVSGQAAAKRALLIAASGNHNLLLYGPPGTGKTMLAKCIPSILPPLTTPQLLETTHIHSFSFQPKRFLKEPPFRSPHHSSSLISLIGGGAKPLPGEVSLAHNGVLFLDEIAEFSQKTLETLRQPLEDGSVTIARSTYRVSFPAQCMLVGSYNPCPCGFLGDPEHECICSMRQIHSYKAKLSGPLLDRIDLHVPVTRIPHQAILSDSKSQYTSEEMRKLVATARSRQLLARGHLNGQLSNQQIKQLQMSQKAWTTLDAAAKKLRLSPRSYIRCIKVAQTITDLSEANQITASAVLEALQFRPQTD